MDSIAIHDLEVWTHIGVTPEERAKEQCLEIGIWLRIDQNATQSDRISDTVDYSEVAAAIRALAKEDRNTIEKLGEDIAEMILHDFAVKNVTVHVQKNIIPGARVVALTIDRP